MLMARSGCIVMPIEGAPAITATATNSFSRDAFVQLAEPYRRQIKAHCYRMTGSLHEAEDLVQETYLRAWRAFESFQGRGSLKAWLHQIATRVCLDAIAQRRKVRRLLPEAIFPPATAVPTGQPPADIAWLEPYPNSEVDDVADEAPNAEAQYLQRESVRLAFVAALQYLPPVSARCCCSSTCWVGLPSRPLRSSAAPQRPSTAPCSAHGRRLGVGTRRTRQSSRCACTIKARSLSVTCALGKARTSKALSLF